MDMLQDEITKTSPNIKSLLGVPWLDRIGTLYRKGHFDTTPGEPMTLRQILLCEFAHWLPVITQLRALDRNNPQYETLKKALKAKLGGFILNHMDGRKGSVIAYTGLLCLDYDYKDIKDFDIDELMQVVFNLPFIAFCGKSCSGDGFYALAEIAEPEKLREYAEHLFCIMQGYGITVDVSKGRNYNDLRYVSYDCNMMIKESPEPLKVKQFKSRKPVYKTITPAPIFSTGTDGRIIKGLNQIASAQVGQRFEVVRKWSYLIGGLGGSLDQILSAIQENPAFRGEESSFIKCAKDSFNDGSKKPIAA